MYFDDFGSFRFKKNKKLLDFCNYNNQNIGTNNEAYSMA